MSGPSICVAIPAYEHAGMLADAIGSVLSQCAPGDPVAVLVVDDASRENLRACVDLRTAGAPVPIRYVRNERNLGLAGNWNRCLDLADGEIVNILHSDARLAAGALARVRAAFAAHAGLGMVFSGHAPPDVVLPAGPAAAAELLKGVSPVSAAFLSREALRRAGRFDERYSYCPDLEFFPRVAARAPSLCFMPRLAEAPPHSGQFMFRTWERDDFLPQFLAAQAAARAHAGQDEAAREAARGRDLHDALLTIVPMALRHGHRALGRRYWRLAREQGVRFEGRSARLAVRITLLPGGALLGPLAWRLAELLASRRRRR